LGVRFPAGAKRPGREADADAEKLQDIRKEKAGDECMEWITINLTDESDLLYDVNGIEGSDRYEPLVIYYYNCVFLYLSMKTFYQSFQNKNKVSFCF
jgi:hypothetical protein